MGQNAHPVHYEDVLEVQGIKIPYVKSVISERMAAVIQKGRYEASEIRMVRKILRPTDKVLELGAGVGVVSSAAAQIVGGENTVTIEANPYLLPVILETHRMNGVEGATVLNGVGVGIPNGKTMPFYVREHFWASSLEAPDPEREQEAQSVSVPQIEINSVLRAQKPNIVVMDIEGGELELLPSMDLSSCRHVIVELHPKVYKLDGTKRCFDALQNQGFAYDARLSRGGTVVVFTKVRKRRATAPRVTAITCMKDEGPFILEWIAYHKSIGVTDFLIFTNDCSDGTTEILDRLDELGHVRHLPNFSSAIESQRHQLEALHYAPYHKQVRNADWVISIDVDEFINVHVGDRTLNALFQANPKANVISLCHLDFGCNGIEKYRDTPIVEQMTACANKHPTEGKRRGIKTLIHKSVPEYDLSNHRPFFCDPDDPAINWVDGAGKSFSRNRQRGQQKGMPPQGAYEQAQLNHYPIRSMESYLAKSVKGNVIAKDSYVGTKYWAKRNQNAHQDKTILPLLAQTKDLLHRLLSDHDLHALHQRAVDYHIAEIRALRMQDGTRELLRQIKKLHEEAHAPSKSSEDI